MAVALAFLAFNVIGYVAITNDLFLLLDPSQMRHFDSYFGRVSSLAFFGFCQSVLCIGGVAVAGLILFLSYSAILYIGGYREPQEKAC